MSKKYVFDFTEGGVGDVNLLGIKGGNLAQMTQMGLPVPLGFNITTDACKRFLQDKTLTNDQIEQILRAVKRMEKQIGLELGDADKPLLLSMRTGASIKMKGLARTVLNIGLNDEIVSKLVRSTKNPVFAWELYCRFIRDYCTIVAKMDLNEIKKAEREIRIENAGAPEPEILQKIISQFKKMYRKEFKSPFPQNVNEQLLSTICAGLESWDSEQARVYRRVNNLPDDLGCAVSVQAMVYGNYDMESGVGVAHTRNVITGERDIDGEFVRRTQDKALLKSSITYDMAELKKENPAIFTELEKACRDLERYFQNVMTLEFCIQCNKLYIMQVEVADRTPQASVKSAVEMAQERLFNKKYALSIIEPSGLKTLLQPAFDADRENYVRVLSEGLCVYPGCASGVIALSSAMALEFAGEGLNVILVKESTNAQDAEGIAVASGLLTTTGGSNSHAGVVARTSALPCIVNCKRMDINENTHSIKIGGINFREGDTISMNAGRGRVYGEPLPMIEQGTTGDLGTIMEWSKPLLTMPIYADADTPQKIQRAVSLGANGVGLLRTENMFFQTDKLALMRKFLLAPDKKLKEHALKSMQRVQTADFVEIMKEVGTKELNIRLMDPPFHKFLPNSQNTLRSIARDLGLNYEKIRESADNLMQSNPMMGIRGCRLLIMFPELIEMQINAIANALIEVHRRTNKMPTIRIIVPLVSILPEFEVIETIIRKTFATALEKVKFAVPYEIGCMIETPRACMIADRIAEHADFVCFGTNDLTQLTFGYSRDDCTKFLREYYSDSLLYTDPFTCIDKNGVYDLMKIAVEKVRSTKPKLPIWLFGEHASDPESLQLALQLKIDKVSCTPNKIPSAILAQAQAELIKKAQ